MKKTSALRKFHSAMEFDGRRRRRRRRHCFFLPLVRSFILLHFEHFVRSIAHSSEKERNAEAFKTRTPGSQLAAHPVKFQKHFYRGVSFSRVSQHVNFPLRLFSISKASSEF